MSKYTKTNPKFFKNVRTINDIKERRCSKCKEWKPETTEFYYMTNKSKPEKGFKAECKKCSIAASGKHQKDNPEQYYWYKRKNQLGEQWKINNRECQRRLRQSGKKREYFRNNTDKTKIYNSNRKLKNHKINISEWIACKEYFENACAYCGLTENEHKEMYNEQLHKEHVINNGEDNLSNCVPACKVCNSSKWKFNLENWHREQLFFTEERLKKIYEWLNDDYKTHKIKAV